MLFGDIFTFAGQNSSSLQKICIERQNNLEFSDKSREIWSLFLGRPLEFAKPPNPRKARDGTIAYAGV